MGKKRKGNSGQGNRLYDTADIEEGLNSDTSRNAGSDASSICAFGAGGNPHSGEDEGTKKKNNGTASEEAEFFANDDVGEIGFDDRNDIGGTGAQTRAPKAALVESDESLKRLPTGSGRLLKGIGPDDEPGPSASGQGNEEAGGGDDGSDSSDQVKRAVGDGVEHHEEGDVHEREHSHISLREEQKHGSSPDDGDGCKDIERRQRDSEEATAQEESVSGEEGGNRDDHHGFDDFDGIDASGKEEGATKGMSQNENKSDDEDGSAKKNGPKGFEFVDTAVS